MLLYRMIMFVSLTVGTTSLFEIVGFSQSSEEAIEAETPKRKKRKRKKKNMPASGEEGSSLQPAEPSPSSRPAQLAPSPQPAPSLQPSPSAWFPPWQPERFDWMLQPIIAFKYTQGVNEATGTTRTTTVEGGLAAGLVGVPVVLGNPGYTVGPRAGIAYGYSSSIVKADGDSENTEGYHYRRQWSGLDNAFYFKSFRYALNLTRGELIVSEQKDRRIQSFRADNDFGVLFRSWWSGHYSLNHARAYNTGFNTPFLVENDHWLHTKFTVDLLDFVFDLGPGFTDVDAWDLKGKDKVGSGNVNYFMLKTRFNPLWKLVGEGVGKYAINASEKQLGLYANERLPEEDLNEPSTLAMPEDSFLGSIFFGVKELFFGVGIGWRYNIQILNLAEKDGAERETTRDHGLGFYYDVRL